jgi:hypothetical protein
MMKKGVMVGLFVLVIGCGSLFAIDLGGGFTLDVYSNNTYGLNDNNRGICINISIDDRGNSYSICVDNQYRTVTKASQYMTEAAISDALKWLLTRAGIAARYANVAVTTILLIFEPSPAL